VFVAKGTMPRCPSRLPRALSRTRPAPLRTCRSHAARAVASFFSTFGLRAVSSREVTEIEIGRVSRRRWRGAPRESSAHVDAASRQHDTDTPEREDEKARSALASQA